MFGGKGQMGNGVKVGLTQLDVSSSSARVCGQRSVEPSGFASICQLRQTEL